MAAHTLPTIKVSPNAGTTAQWFRVAEQSGDFMGIRYGRAKIGSDSIKWSFIPHDECDGIGGFARMLRARGSPLTTLPTTANPRRGWIRPLWQLWRASRQPANCSLREDWMLYNENPPGPSQAVAWHLFSETETAQIRKSCRQRSVSVNSYLLQQLDQAVRPDLHQPSAILEWMIPVNLRGDVIHLDDTANHVSYISPTLSPSDSLQSIQQQIRGRLSRSEHWGHYLVMLCVGKLLSERAMLKLISQERNKPQGNIGAFSNLGVWDSARRLDPQDFWLFCPPVAQGQLLGAGCLTYQNRLSLTLQGHPGLSDRPQLAQEWMARWLKGIHRCIS
jgi:hypothetical protein